jgi:hypothetical protein
VGHLPVRLFEREERREETREARREERRETAWVRQQE